jgi:hypothetical protein
MTGQFPIHGTGFSLVVQVNDGDRSTSLHVLKLVIMDEKVVAVLALTKNIGYARESGNGMDGSGSGRKKVNF